MVFRIDAMHAPSISNRVIRRTVTAGAGLALMLGMAVPAHADGVTAPQPTASAASVAAAPAKPAVKAAAKPAVKAPAAPATATLMPRTVTASQTSVKPTAAQMANAKAIIEEGQAMGLKPRAWVIAVATSLQESKLTNLGNLGNHNDHDSLGLFQQRPSSGWGTPAQVTNPQHAAHAFYHSLVRVPGWDKLPLTVAAQRVQVSAFGDRYAQWEKEAANLVLAAYNAGPMAAHPAA